MEAGQMERSRNTSRIHDDAAAATGRTFCSSPAASTLKIRRAAAYVQVLAQRSYKSELDSRLAVGHGLLLPF
jgi:hypothetical protein